MAGRARPIFLDPKYNLGVGGGFGGGGKGIWPLAPSPKSIIELNLPLPGLELAHLVHEGLQARPGVGLFLAVVGQVQEGDVVVALP